MSFGEPPPPDVSELPEEVDPRGVLPPRGGRDAFVLALAVTVALLGLIFTLGFIVYSRLTAQ